MNNQRQFIKKLKKEPLWGRGLSSIQEVRASLKDKLLGISLHQKLYVQSKMKK